MNRLQCPQEYTSFIERVLTRVKKDKKMRRKKRFLIFGAAHIQTKGDTRCTEAGYGALEAATQMRLSGWKWEKRGPVRPISKGMPWQHKGVEWIPKTDRCITIADIRYFKKTALFCDFWACLSFCNQWIFGSGRGVTCAACVLACIHLQSHFKHHILKKVALF